MENYTKMFVEKIPYTQIPQVSKLMKAYLAQDDEVRQFYNRFPELSNFEQQIAEKQQNYPKEIREVLHRVLLEQYKHSDLSELLEANLSKLQHEDTFTITTGHQLNIFTGPLYFLYKIISTINLCKQLEAQFPSKSFVPVYWMATEDHDYDEINHFTIKGEKLSWESEEKGMVGDFSTAGFQELYERFDTVLGPGVNASYLRELFQKSYLSHDNLADATRYLVNELFGADGLVIVDANNVDLKRCFIPYVKRELEVQVSYHHVSETVSALGKSHKIQVNPRKINLFYVNRGVRERIVYDKGVYRVLETPISWSHEELLVYLEENPHHFSPNVLLRPVYQEVLLPNLCYIGGGGELAYWLQLQSTFTAFKVTFPMILLRNAVLLIGENQFKKLNKLNVAISDLFLSTHELQKKLVSSQTSIAIDFTEQRNVLHDQFSKLKKIAADTDASFIGAVLAQEKKQLKGLDTLEKRLLRAEKRKHRTYINKVLAIREELFPYDSLQERKINFSEFYLSNGSQLIAKLKEVQNPLEQSFIVLPVE